MSKKIIPIIVLVAVIGGMAFYGGMKYGQSKTPAGIKNFLPEDFQNLSPEQRQEFMSRDEGRSFTGTGRLDRLAGPGLLNGQVIAKDEQSITIKIDNGGSKIIFFSYSTEIGKFINGTIDEIAVGQQISVTGKQNSDGSYTANNIRLIENSQ